MGLRWASFSTTTIKWNGTFCVFILVLMYILHTLISIDEQKLEYRNKIARLKGFEDAFELVKSAISTKFKMHRAGLSLILQVMPNNLGAYHILGSNVIVVNRYVLYVIKNLSKSTEEYNSYLFMVLAHEYLHSFGIMDENVVRQMTYNLCMSLLGESHAATLMAKEDPSSLFPQLKMLPQSKFEREYEIVKDFDKKNQSYIS